MKKYLIIGDAESPHIVKWAREMNKHFELYLVSSRNVHAEIRSFIPDERIFTFKLKPAEAVGNLDFFRMIFPLKRIIKQVKPDYVNAHYITSHGFVTALARKLSSYKFPLILTAWGTDILVTPFRNRFYKKMTAFTLKQAALVTTDSLIVANIILELSNVPSTTFPFGLQGLPEAAQDEKDPNLFFSNRTLIANSNIDRVLHFFSKVKIANEDARLIIAHEGPLKEKLIALSNELGLGTAVEFIGFITADEQNELYRRSQFYFSLLTSDALSVSLLEALSFGCIPILSDLPDNREWITDGENGIILKENTDLHELSNLQERAKEIFTFNRALIESKAIFPKAIDDFCQKLQSL